MVSVVLMMEVEDVVWNVGKFSSRTLMEGAEASCGDNPELNILTSMEVMVNVRVTNRWKLHGCVFFALCAAILKFTMVSN